MHLILKSFSALCDFQYLPMEKNPDHRAGGDGDPYRSIIDQVVPQKLVSLDWLDEPSPIFMSPPLFSRMDMPVVRAAFFLKLINLTMLADVNDTHQALV